MVARRIYLAAPLFSESELSANIRLAEILETKCAVFLPQRDGHLLPDMIAGGMSPALAYRRVFDKDVNAIRRCDAVVAVLDGRTIDEGTAFELGIAFALGKVCVGYHTDPRVLVPWGINPMIQVPLSRVLKNHKELAAWVSEFSNSELDGEARRIVG